MNSEIIQHKPSNSVVKIEKGELVSFQFNNEEIMHQKGAPGWRNTDTEMFPIVGPTAQNNFRVNTPKGTCIQDQHGLLRELEYSILEKSEDSIKFIKIYKANTPVKNSKFPTKSSEELVSWPYDFSFIKSFKLTSAGLLVSFEIESEVGMPFMLGYHPAFKLNGDASEIVKTNSKHISINEILEVGDVALPVLNTSEIRLQKKSGYDVIIQSKGYHHYMLWTPVPNMLCIEPVTAYPYTEEGLKGENMFRSTTTKNVFEVLISPV